MNRTIQISGADIVGADIRQQVTVPVPGQFHVDSNGSIAGLPLLGVTDTFDLLPATSVAAGTDKYFLLSGTSAAIAMSDSGGVAITTNTTNAGNLDGVASTAFAGKIRPASEIRFATRVNIAAVTAVVASFGLSENVGNPDPTGTAGEGALFLFDPTSTVSTGLTTAQHLNWILAHKVNGTDTFTATSVPVAAGVDYELVIRVQPNLTSKFYINGVYVGVGPTLTSGDTFRTYLGLKGTAASQVGTVRYVQFHRNIG